MEKKDKIIGSIIMVVGCAIFLIVGYIISKPKAVNTEEVFIESKSKYDKEKENSIFQESESNYVEKNNTSQFKEIIVEIKGEVKNPKVYTMEYNSRVIDLVNKAGGFTERADTMSINSSLKLRDEDCIIVYSKEDLKKININQNMNKSAYIDSRANSDKININLATKEELKTVPGIGDVTAQKIIDYRENNGAFNSIEELTKIDRIGPKTLEKIRDKIEVR